MRRAIVAAAVLLASCAAPVDRRWQEGEGYRWRALADAGQESPGFTAIEPSASGLTHRNDVADEAALANRHLLLGAGVAVGDIDGDAQPDLVFAATSGALHIYHNDGAFRFRDVTATSGVTARGAPATGVVLADVDGDGALDLVVGTLAGPLSLWHNDGRGRFTDVTPTSGLPAGRAVTTMTFADVDGDGDLDGYVATYKARTALDAYPPQDRAFDQVVKKIGDRYVVAPQWQAEYRVEDRPDLGGVVRSQRAEPDLFLRNDGRGHFTVEPVAGPRFRDATGAPLAEPPDFFTLAARFYDVTGDGAPDLYACNDFEDPDQFWRNDGQGNFQLFPADALAATSNTCMSVEFGDIDRDGAVDLFTADMLAPTRTMRQRQVPTHTPLPKTLAPPRDRPQWMRNMLHRARGDGTWSEIAEQAGVAATDWTWGSLFLDIDLDGFEDLLVANGHRWDIREADVYDAIRDRFPRVAWNREQGEFPPDTARVMAFRNGGALGFESMGVRWRVGTTPGIHHAMAAGDLDGDGDLDVVITRLNDTPLLYRNDATAPRVLVQAPVGAQVTVQAAGLPPQSREITAGGLYLASAAPQVAFATGAADTVTVVVRTRDGRERRMTGVPTGRELVVRDADMATVAPRGPAAPTSPAAPAAPAASTALASPVATTLPAPLFIDATALLDGATHRDQLFDDFSRQPLLPSRLSQLGPGVSWVDIDGDGREELLLTGGRADATRLLRWRDGRYREVRAWPALSDHTTALPMPTPAGGTQLLIGQTRYEAADPLALPAVLVASTSDGTAPATPDSLAVGDSASIGPLALGDVNGDGRLDLFVGARLRPGSWPLPAPSQLWLRQPDGRFLPDVSNAAALRALGLVSSATFVDLDDDGDADLVAVGEFGPIRVLRNTDGRFTDVTAALGLAGMTSRWNGIAPIDADGDGRLDLIATSFGTNTSWQASPERPHALWIGNFGGALPGLIQARADVDGGDDYPLEPLPRLALGVDDVRDRFATFAGFAQATIADVLAARTNGAARIGATTYAHVVLLNRGDRFEVRPLPVAAQLAPAFGIAVADFDGDGHEDVALAQNFSPTAIETPRFVAGQGLVLLGDGAGGFRALSVRDAGVSVLGDQRGAATADDDGDGRPDLVIAQHAGPLRLWRNATGRPGVRVRVSGPPENPAGIGARVSIVHADGREGPVRAITAGSGYWSMSSPIVVLARGDRARAVRLRWPGAAPRDVPLDSARTLRLPWR